MNQHLTRLVEARLGDAADLILMGKHDVAYAHLIETITTLAALDEGDKE